MKQAVILAAGRGTRLNGSMNGRPKCLAKIGNHTLIKYQLMLLRKAGIERVCVVVGYGAEQVRSVLGNTCEYIVNQRYAETNSLYSLWLARDWVSGPFILMNCDVLVHPEILEQITELDGNALAYDSSSGGEDEHMKVSFKGSRLRQIGKELSQKETHGENVGILKFDESGAERLFREADALVHSGGEHLWAPSVLNRIVDKVVFHGVDVAGLPWTEIDFPDDLHYAHRQIWPNILDDIVVDIWIAMALKPAGVVLQNAPSFYHELMWLVRSVWFLVFDAHKAVRLFSNIHLERDISYE